jgi:hypothetical protein
VDLREADSERAPHCASCLGTTSAPTAALWKAWKAAAGGRRRVGGEVRIQRKAAAQERPPSCSFFCFSPLPQTPIGNLVSILLSWS